MYLTTISTVYNHYKDTWFYILEQVITLAHKVAEHPSVDASRVYLMGASMGGYGTWQLAMSVPELCAAMIPVYGGGMAWNVGRLSERGVWAVHGEKDAFVSCEESRHMIEALGKSDKVRFS